MGVGNGVKIREKMKSCGRYSPMLTPTKKNRGQTSERSRYEQKKKFPLYLSPEKKAILERR